MLLHHNAMINNLEVGKGIIRLTLESGKLLSKVKMILFE